MKRRKMAGVSRAWRVALRSRTNQSARLLCSLMLIGLLLTSCTARRLASPARTTATSAGAPVQGAAGEIGTSVPFPPTLSAPSGATAVSLPTPAEHQIDNPDPTPTTELVVTPTTVPTSAPTQAPAATPTALPGADLAAKVDALVAAAPAHTAVEIGLADGTTLYEHNADDLYDAASLYKLGIMVQVYKDRDAGTLTFDDPVTLYPGFFYESDEVYSPDTDTYADVPVGDLLHNMITLSSNVAAEALLNLVGTDNVNQTMADLGLTNTKILWSPVARRAPSHDSTTARSDLNHAPSLVPVSARLVQTPAAISAVSSAEGAYDLTTAADMASLFEQLLAGTVLSPSTSAEMLELLAQQQINNRLPADLPAGTKVAHKTGDLDGLLHDAGVIYAPSGPIVVVVMTDEVTDHDAIVDLMRQIAVLAYEYAP